MDSDTMIWTILFVGLTIAILAALAHKKFVVQKYQPVFSVGMVYQVDNKPLKFKVTTADTYSYTAEGILIVPSILAVRLDDNEIEKVEISADNPGVRRIINIQNLTVNGRDISIVGIESQY